MDAGPRVALLWRRVRWGAAVFCLVQFTAYVPGPGVRPPFPLLPVGLGLAGLIALVNLAAAVVERRIPRTASDDGSPARRDLVLLAADAATVAAVVELLAFDPGTAAWPLLVVPVLQAGLVGRLRWALWTWFGCVVALVVREILALTVHELPTSVQAVVSSLSYRSGVLLLVALVVGVQARVAHEYLQLLHAARRRLAHEASHDQLTGATGRALFLDRADRALRSADRTGELTAVLYVDCDRFKIVNDTHGHEAGDAVLVEVARRLAAAVRPGDTVARLGGDEFAVLLERVAGESEVHRIAGRVRGILARSYVVPGQPTPLPMTCSVGVGMDDKQGDRLASLLRRADTAMYADKHSPHWERPRWSAEPLGELPAGRS